MKIDHLVLNIDEKYQNNTEQISKIKNSGILYEPKFGKGTNGFKATNLWFGREYFEMINIKKKDGGGWVEQWTKMYNSGHRGLICLFIDTDEIDGLYSNVKSNNVHITEPEWLKFKWFFNLFIRTMPWRNSYLPFFENIPLQIGFQEMKDNKSRDFMNQYMFPNSSDNGIVSIKEIVVYGDITKNDIEMLSIVFNDKVIISESCISLQFENGQVIKFIKSEGHRVEVITECTNNDYINKSVQIENVTIINKVSK